MAERGWGSKVKSRGEKLRPCKGSYLLVTPFVYSLDIYWVFTVYQTWLLIIGSMTVNDTESQKQRSSQVRWRESQINNTRVEITCMWEVNIPSKWQIFWRTILVNCFERVFFSKVSLSITGNSLPRRTWNPMGEKGEENNIRIWHRDLITRSELDISVR